MANGGSCVAGPDGHWVLEPQVGEEGLWFAELSIDAVARERQNFDPAGHYSRPDVTRLKVNRKRQATVSFDD
jgi:nitrilase